MSDFNSGIFHSDAMDAGVRLFFFVMLCEHDRSYFGVAGKGECVYSIILILLFMCARLCVFLFFIFI